MNRDTLIARISKTTQWSRKDVERILLAALEEIMEALRRGEEVSLVGFGQFLVTTRRPRRGVNPRNPEQALQIPAVNVVKFRAGKNLKDAARRAA
ncbi:MAG: DNA-binding protein HU-beta [Parcubacteria group bacterium Gr01-1014_38]|nr:MAG: DNA-binding protein HU-beta [Parcubacteria group bacterium Gr01-1014_38]